MPRPFPPVLSPSLKDQSGESFPRLVELMQRLLAPDGCPWDRQQSFQTLRRYLLEETCEVLDAIDGGDFQALREELGDLLLQIVFQAELAREQGLFGPDDVVKAICQKLVRRHPHVFAEAHADDAAQVRHNWERIKAEEKDFPGTLDDVPKSLPGLVRAQRVGERVHSKGFDWPNTEGSRAKVAEELGELDAAIAANDPHAVEQELGDTLFALVNLARHVEVDAETALRCTTNKFIGRFRHVEKRVRETYGGFSEKEPIPLEVLDGYWEEAKSMERE